MRRVLRGLSELFWDMAAPGIGVTTALYLIVQFDGLRNRSAALLGSVMPSVAIVAVHPGERSAESGRFCIDLRKLTRGVPRPPWFYVKPVGTSYGAELPITVHRIDAAGRWIDEGLPEHPVGTPWTTCYLFEMPGTIMPRDRLKVLGVLVHRRWFGDVEERVPDFDLPPVSRR